ncbi:hypothetical protein GCM10010415_43180 [Streptomyces atrovirens]
MLDGCGQREDIGWAGKDADRSVGMVLDEPLPGRREDDGVEELSADQDVRPGIGLGGGGFGRARGTRNHGVPPKRGGGPAWSRATFTGTGFELGFFWFSRTRGSARRDC